MRLSWSLSMLCAAFEIRSPYLSFVSKTLTLFFVKFVFTSPGHILTTFIPSGFSSSRKQSLYIFIADLLAQYNPLKGKANNAQALAILEITPHSSSEVVKKVLNSAAANAEHNLNMNRSDLKVAECFADMGPTLKRMQPVSKGRGYRILKRTSHITVVLDAIK